jgi:hypothetical protein
MREDGRTNKRADMTKLIIAFRNFAIAPKTIDNVQEKVARVLENR